MHDDRRPRRLGRTLVRLVAVSLLAAGMISSGAVAGPADTAFAADASEFDPGNIISDERFFDSTSMNASEIQSFLNARVVTCAAGSAMPCLKSYTQSTPTIGADAYCANYTGASGERASRIIEKVSLACRISPQVLLVLLEKEQGLVSSTSPSTRMYRSATGYGCPDTADCDTAYYGFFNQVYNAARQFQRYTKTSSSWRYQPGRTNSIQYHPNTSCGSSDVYIENQATANLYIYTPYRPNAAALANLYGVGDGCSSYGNRNFWRIYSDWFGNPSNWLRSPSFEGASTAGWSASNGPINRLAARDSRAHDGEWFLAMNTSVSGRALSQDITRTTRVGETATASIWLRSASTERSFSGKVALWGLGGSNEVAVESFAVGAEWTQVVVALPVRRSTHSRVRIDIYMSTTDTTLWVDDAAIGFAPTPPPKNRLVNPSFESGVSPWYPGNGSINLQVAADSRAWDGSRLLATNTSVAGRSIAQRVQEDAVAGETYTFSLRVRSGRTDQPFAGKVALWVLGPSGKRVGTSTFSTENDWTMVTASVTAPATERVSLKAELYLSDVGSTVWLDGAMLSPELLVNGSFELGGAGWGRSNTSTNLAVYSTSTAAVDPYEGRALAETNTTIAGSSVRTDASVDVEKGERYEASIWVRTAKAGATFEGRLALWALDGSQNEAAVTPFSVGDEWTRVAVRLKPTHDDHTRLRLEVYQSTTGVTLRMDGAKLH